MLVADPPRPLSSTLRRRVQTTRTLFLIVAVVYPAFWVVRGGRAIAGHDPLELRLLVSALAIGLFALSWSPDFSRRYLHPFVMTMVYAITIHFFLLLGMNDLALEYLIGALLILAGVSAAADLAFPSRFALRSYLIVVGAGSVAAAVIARQPAISRPFFLLTMATGVGLTYVALGSQLAAIRELRESRRRLLGVVSGAPLVLWSTDQTGRLEFLSGTGVDLLEDRSVEYLGRPVDSMFDDGKDVREAFAAALRGETGHARARSGDHVLETWHAPAGGDEEATGSVGIAIDITDRWRAERALRRKERQLADSQSIAHLGSWRWEVDADRVEWSDEMYRIYGYEPGEIEVTLERFLSHVHEGDRERVRGVVAGALAARTPFDFEERIHTRDGETRILQSRGYVVSREDRPVAMVGTCYDVTRQRKAEEDLRRVQKLEAVGRLAGGVAHDFNNLLMVIRGYTDQLLRDEPDPEEETCLREIERAAASASDLVEKLLAFGRRGTLEAARYEIDPLVRDLAGILDRAVGDDIRLAIDLRAGSALVEVDRTGLEQILLNLAMNGRDAMPDGGTLTIETGLNGSDEVWITVRDDGQGMEPDTVDRAFEPFYTTKPEGSGSGLGLASVFGIVKQSGGEVTIDSEVGVGTAVRLSLPRVDARPGDQPA